jgi:hypothetical protein
MVVKHAYWEYCEIRQLYLLRNFFEFQNDSEPFDLEKIERNSIQNVYLTNILITRNKMVKFKTDNEYAFITETIFSAIPQAFLQADIFYQNFYKHDGSFELIVQFIRIFFAIYSISEGSASFIDYFPAFLFSIEITSSFFYILRILTNILFFSSRLMCIVVAFNYYKIAVALIISGHFVVYFILNFFCLLCPKTSKLTNFLVSFYIVSLKMTTFFEEISLDKTYLAHNLFSWLENVFFAYSFYKKRNEDWIFENFLLYFSIFSFLFGLVVEFFLVKKFIKKSEEKKYANSIINDSFRKTKLQFNSVFL